jgi:choline dehydrogenase-like flavoprotein
MSRYDVVVIGGGAAGLSAALVLSRARRKVLVVDAGRPRNAPATHMYGYLTRNGLPPAELLTRGRAEVESYGGNIIAGTASALTPDGRGGFCVRLAAGQRISARRLLLTTGLRDDGYTAQVGLARQAHRLSRHFCSRQRWTRKDIPDVHKPGAPARHLPVERRRGRAAPGEGLESTPPRERVSNRGRPPWTACPDRARHIDQTHIPHRAGHHPGPRSVVSAAVVRDLQPRCR